VLTAAMTPSIHLEGGLVVQRDGIAKLAAATAFEGWPSLKLEAYANRDSVRPTTAARNQDHL